MTIQHLTEGQYFGEFIRYELDPEYTREVKTVASGESLVDGQLVQLSTGSLVAKDANLDTEGDFVTAVEGIVFGKRDATDAAIPAVPYLKRGPAVVVDDLITYPTESTEGGQKVAAVAALLAMNIIVR